MVHQVVVVASYHRQTANKTAMLGSRVVVVKWMPLGPARKLVTAVVRSCTVEKSVRLSWSLSTNYPPLMPSSGAITCQPCCANCLWIAAVGINRNGNHHPPPLTSAKVYAVCSLQLLLLMCRKFSAALSWTVSVSVTAAAYQWTSTGEHR